MDDQQCPPPPYTECSEARPQAVPQTPFPHLRRSIVIPATAASLGSPFLRAYPPILETFHISRQQFSAILDGLNRVAVRNPPLQALGLVGQALEFVPLSTAQMVGLAINITSQIGTYAVSKGATAAYLRRANEDVFVPRGLKMEIARLDAVARINKIPILNAAGGIRTDLQLLQPLLNMEEMQTIGVTKRWLQTLEPWVQPLELDTLPPVNIDSNLWGKLHTMASEHERKSSEQRVLKKRTKAFDKHQRNIGKADRKKMEKLTKLENKEQKVCVESPSRKVDDKLRKIEKKREKAEMEHNNKMEKVTEDLVGKDKEEKAMAKVLWLIIRSAHEYSGVEGTMDISRDY